MNTMFKGLAAVLLAVSIGGGGGVALANLWKARAPAYIEGDYVHLFAQAGRPVIVLGTAWCEYCKQTRAYLQASGVEYADWDIEQSAVAAEHMRNLGSAGVPVILIGDRQIRGFDVAAINAALHVLKVQARGAV